MEDRKANVQALMKEKTALLKILAEKRQQRLQITSKMEVPDWDQREDESHEEWLHRVQTLARDLHQDREDFLSTKARFHKISKSKMLALDKIPSDDLDAIGSTIKRWHLRLKLCDTFRTFSQSEVAAGLRKRNRALNEIIETEETYVAALEKLVANFLLPLVGRLDLITKNEHKLLFGSIRPILRISTEFLKQLKTRLAKWPTVQIFGNLINKSTTADDFKKYYTKFIDSYDQRASLLVRKEKEPAFREWHNSVLKKTMSTLGDLLINPVQRMPRYKILLENLIKYTPDVHVDYQNLIAARDHMVKLIEYMNEHARMTQNVHRQMKQVEATQVLQRNSTGKLHRKKSHGFAINSGGIGKLQISIISGRNLPIMDSKASDPYVKLEMDEQVYTSQIVKKNINPEWNENCVMIVMSKASVLTLTVWDWNRVGLPDFMGEIKFEAQKFTKALTVSKVQNAETWYELRQKGGGPGEGELSLRFVFSQLVV